MSILDYLRHKKGTIAAFIICAAVVFLCLALYGAELKMIIYPFALCALIGFVFLAAGYIRDRRTYEELEILSRMKAEMIDELPEPCSPKEEQYQEIIRRLCEEEKHRETVLTAKMDDMMDYYTAWVHQIKTPIAAMKLAFQNEDSPLARQSLTDLKRIEQYVDMVLTYFKLNSGSQDFVICEQNLDGIIKQAVRDFAGDFINRKISLEYEPVDYIVLTDGKWLLFVIEQVISNALKYTSEGTVKIYMEGDVLCIKDTGIGIEQSDIPRIFEKGFTGFNGRKDRTASGIGLYLCKRICDSLSHGISVESEVGKGTVVRIDLGRRPVGIE